MKVDLSTWPDFPNGLRILLLDGSSQDRQETETLLIESSYKVTCCSTTQEAVAELVNAANNFHLIVADSQALNGETGESLKLLHRLKKFRKSLPFIVLSSSSNPSEVVHGLNHGAAEVIRKPLAPLKARTLYQHTIRKMMSKPNLSTLDSSQNSQDESDSNSLDNPRTSSAEVCDFQKSCETCSSDSTSNLADVLAFDIDSRDFAFESFVDTSASLLDPPTSHPLNFESLAMDSVPSSTAIQHTPLVPPSSMPVQQPAKQPLPPCSITPPSTAPSPISSSCASSTPPLPPTPPPCSIPVPQLPAPMQPMLTMPGMPGMPLWGMPPMPMMAGMMPGCPPFPMMPPFMRPPFMAGMPMPGMGMGGPMMPFPMCPMPMGMNPMGAMNPMMMPPMNMAPACQTMLPQMAPTAAPAPVVTPAADVAPAAVMPLPAPMQPSVATMATTGAVPEVPSQSAGPAVQPKMEPSTEASALSQWDAAGFTMDDAHFEDPPLGLQLKKSDSFLDLLTHHLFSSGTYSS